MAQLTHYGIWINVDFRFADPDWMCSARLINQVSQDLTIINAAFTWSQAEARWESDDPPPEESSWSGLRQAQQSVYYFGAF